MRRVHMIPRTNFGTKLEEIGLSFHSWDDYWKEDVAYKFTSSQVDVLEAATEELHTMCIEAVQFVIDNDRFSDLDIPKPFWSAIKQSFYADQPTLYGRFDFAYDGVLPPKMLEYNADTPTSLLESAVAQWYWLQDVRPRADQFNSLHEKLVDRWKDVCKDGDLIHFSSLKDNEEDWVCVHYLMDTAKQSGFDVKHVFIEDIGWDDQRKKFIDQNDIDIKNLFKLYPWEWLMREEFAEKILCSDTNFIEPIWKSILACKGILAILWEMYPNHPLLLPAYFSKQNMTSYAKKPLFSREGANVELVKDSRLIASDTGPYSDGKYVYQQLYDIPSMEGKYPVIGSWVVGDVSAGICMREDSGKITTNMSNFVPHYFE